MRLIETEEDYTTTTGKLAVVVFSAGWCRNCKMIKSHLDTLAAAHPTVVRSPGVPQLPRSTRTRPLHAGP